MIIRKRVRNIIAQGNPSENEVEFCRAEFHEFFDLGRTKMESWDIVSSDEKPATGLATTVYETKPDTRWDNLVKYKRKNGRYYPTPYLIICTMDALQLTRGKRYVWLEYRGRG